MLPKVSAALSKFVTPIQTTSAGSSAHEKQFVRAQPERKGKVLPFKDQKSGHQDEPTASGQQRLDQNQNQSQDPEQPQLESPADSGGRRELGSSFLSLFALLRSNSVFRWIGVNGYRLGMKATRRGGRLRKGAMLDVKVD